MDSATRNIVLTGSIEATTSDGASLRAQELKWTSAEGVLTAEGDAEITRDDIRARATASRAPMNSRGLRLQETHV